MTPMSAISEQFGAWVTNFKGKSFDVARLQLTAYYTLSMMGLFLVFNLVVFELFGSDILETPEERTVNQNISEEQHIIDAAQDRDSLRRLQTILYGADIVVFFLAIIMSYVLTRKTLLPIETMHRKQEKFVSDVTHELRTPLAVMKMGAEGILAQPASSEEYVQYIREALEEVVYMSNMVDDLLFLVRHDGEKQTVFSEIDLQKLVQREVGVMRPYAEPKGVTLLEETRNVSKIWGGNSEIKRLLTNLIRNAIDYNTPHGMVTVSLHTEKEGITLTVSDTGIGISPEHQEHIFDRFYKVDQARTEECGGAGLGLAIVREIVDRHGGTIALRSTRGRGSVITVFFPTV